VDQSTAETADHSQQPEDQQDRDYCVKHFKLPSFF
jgi:hypothetical protein